MAKKKNMKLSVPLMPEFKKKGAFNANFTDIVVGKLTVKKDDKYPGTIRFENDVPMRTEALIEEGCARVSFKDFKSILDNRIRRDCQL